MTHQHRKLAMIAAVGPGLELGRQGDLVWHIAADLKNFKRITTGHPVIMGRKTWESLPKRPLPGRLNIVLSRTPRQIDGAVTVTTVKEAINACEGLEMPFVIGGAEIYRMFLPEADELFITAIDADPGEGVDSWFPDYKTDRIMDEASEWETTQDGVNYRFEHWIKG